jgi:hypothetical protein
MYRRELFWLKSVLRIRIQDPVLYLLTLGSGSRIQPISLLKKFLVKNPYIFRQVDQYLFHYVFLKK